jgi:hypothetical protein
VIHGVHCFDDEVLNSGVDQRTDVGDRSLGRGVENVVAPRALIALLDAFGKVVGELGPEGRFVLGENRPTGGVGT